MESTEHDKQAQTHTPQERKIGRRCIAVGAIILALQIGLMSWVMSDDSREERGTERPQPKSSAQVFGPIPHEPSDTQLFPSCGEIKRRAIEWKNDNFEIDFDPSSCNGTLTFHNPLMPHKQNELPFSRMPVTYAHNEADVTITVGKPDHKIPDWDRYVPRPGNYNVVLIDHNTFIELRLTKQGKSYAMCAPWRPIPLCGKNPPSLRRHR